MTHEWLDYWINGFSLCIEVEKFLSKVVFEENFKRYVSFVFTVSRSCYTQHHTSEFLWKMFQAAQLTHERFLTIYHSCKIFFWYLSTKLNSSVYYYTLRLGVHTLGWWKFIQQPLVSQAMMQHQLNQIEKSAEGGL